MKIPRDKLLHLAAGFLTGLSAILIGWWALVLVAAVGVLKEVRDAGYFEAQMWLTHVIRQPGTPDKWDAIATCVGGAISTSLVMLWIG